MLDLTQLGQERFELIWFDGTELQLEKPSKRMMNDIVKIRELTLKGNGYTAEIITVLYGFAHKIINRNTDGRIFEIEEVEQYSLEVINVIIKEYNAWVFDLTSKKN